MCDYSLHLVRSRPAKVGDRLITMEFADTVTRGFASANQPAIAVCLAPGTELAFDGEPEYYRPYTRQLLRVRPAKVAGNVARFRRINQDRGDAHHDALEFANGTVVLLTRFCPGQHATVLQLPVTNGKATASAQASVKVPVWAPTDQ